MFTGIIQATTPVLSARTRGGCRAVRIKKPPRWKLALGASVAVDGICSTIVKRTALAFDVEYMPETISKTTAGAFVRGRVVNLERPLAFGASLDGHLVEGHVDARGRVAATVDRGRVREIVIAAPQKLVRRVALHGAVCINGVSLTVARKRGAAFTVALIPYTLAHTNLARLTVGDEVNIETDRDARTAFTVFRGSATVARNAKKTLRKKR